MFSITSFKNKEYGDVNVIVENGKVYFESSKTAKMLGYSNPNKAVLDHCEKDGITNRYIRVSSGTNLDGIEIKRSVNKKFIDEGNLYRLILKSKLPTARKFESWVVNEILPSIRTYGAYIDDETIQNIIKNPEYLYNLAINLKEEREKVNNLKEVIKDNETYTTIGKIVSYSNDSISIGAFAKLLNNMGIRIGRNRLFAWFRANGYLMNQYHENQPKQKYIEQGLFTTREFVINTSNGPKLQITTYITGKGQNYFINIIKGEFKYENTYRYN